MGSTPIYQFPFPNSGDQSTVPVDIEELALAVEAMLYQRAGEYRQDYSAKANMTCTSQTWTASPTGSDASMPLEISCKNPASLKIAITIGCYMGVDAPTNCAAEMGFRIYKGSQILVDMYPARNILYNGTDTSTRATAQRTFLQTIPGPAVAGDLLLVRAYFRNNGTTGTAYFSYPGITVNTRTSSD